jgi:3-methyl-2-oxobutanoate hydroxymethyltransferase
MPERTKIALPDLLIKKKHHEPITMLTAYDYPTALLVDQAGVDVILVGDTLGMVVLGYETTLPVTMDEMLHHCRAVRRGAHIALLVGDMPFLSYQTSIPEAIHNAGRFLKEAGMEAVKLEGGVAIATTIHAMVTAGIPVVGHIGLQPQSVAKMGRYKAQGTTAASARQLLADAQALEAAGCFAIVLEGIADRVAALITQRLHIPTIGIGAGAQCDGQVLVLHDILGLYDRFTPRFVKQYAKLAPEIRKAAETYCDEVRSGSFPGTEHVFTISDAEYAALTGEIGLTMLDGNPTVSLCELP